MTINWGMQKKLQIANRKVTLMRKAQVVHTHQTSRRRGWPRRFDAQQRCILSAHVRAILEQLNPAAIVYTWARSGGFSSMIWSCCSWCHGSRWKKVKWLHTLVTLWIVMVLRAIFCEEILANAPLFWCTKFQSSFLNIYFRLSGLKSSLLNNNLRFGPNRCSHKRIRYATLHFLRHRNRA